MRQFDLFVILARMRTGSNFLEVNLNAVDGLTCYGEAFNPHFVGAPNRHELLETDLSAREGNPLGLLERMKVETEGLPGFRYFHDHDPRVFEPLLNDPRCAKIILSRNPIESYVSLKIAQATGQWKLTDARRHKDSRIDFDAVGFARHLEEANGFSKRILKSLQRNGQTAFHLDYEDLQDVDVVNGLLRFLGMDTQLETLDKSLKKQNAKPISEKVRNFDEMDQILSDLDLFSLSKASAFEPRRGPAVRAYIAAAKTPLLFMPIKGGPEREVRDWMAQLDGGAQDDLLQHMTQRDLRSWMEARQTHRSFTVLSHPARRAHRVFCQRILSVEEGGFLKIRGKLQSHYGLHLPDGGLDQSYDIEWHRNAFSAFLRFLKSNLVGQTSVRVDPAWASQHEVLQGFGEFALPDRLIREDRLEIELRELLEGIGGTMVPMPPPIKDSPFALENIYDSSLETLVQSVYKRDYLHFGFGPWADQAA